MAMSRVAYIARDSAVAFLAAVAAAMGVYWLVRVGLGELEVIPPLDVTGLFTLQQWEERYMRTTLLICTGCGVVVFIWSMLGSGLWRGKRGDGRLTWVLLCVGTGVAALGISWVRLPPTEIGSNTALMLQSAAGILTVWLGTLVGAPLPFRFTPIGARWVRAWLPW